MRRPRLAAGIVLVITTVVLVAYLVASLVIVFALWFHTGFCDTAEEDCALPWTTGRVVRWIAWPLIGVAVIYGYRWAVRTARAAGEARAGRITTGFLVLAALLVSVPVGFMVLQMLSSP